MLQKEESQRLSQPEVQHQDKASFNTNVNPFTEDKLNFATWKTVLMLGYKCIWTLSQTSFWWQIYCRKLTLLTFWAKRSHYWPFWA